MVGSVLALVMLLAIGCGQSAGDPQQVDAPAGPAVAASPEPEATDAQGVGKSAEGRTAPPGWDALPTAPASPGSTLSQTPTPGRPAGVDEVSAEPGRPRAIHQETTQETSAEQGALVTGPTPVPVQSPATLTGRTFAGGGGGGPIGTADVKNSFKTDVFGSRGNAKDIVFVVDASGSMVDVLPFVVKELKRVLGGLSPQQRVTVICFSGEGIYEVNGGGGGQADRGLREATPEFKEHLYEWLSIENYQFPSGGRGAQHAEQALARGLAYKPQMMFVLSDSLTGGGQGATRHEISQAELLKAVKAANQADPPAKINTIQFLYEDPLVRAGLTGTLQLLADETGGSYRFIGARDLNLK